MERLIRKIVFLFKPVNTIARLNKQQLFLRAVFYSTLRVEHLSENDDG